MFLRTTKHPPVEPPPALKISSNHYNPHDTGNTYSARACPICISLPQPLQGACQPPFPLPSSSTHRSDQHSSISQVSGSHSPPGHRSPPSTRPSNIAFCGLKSSGGEKRAGYTQTFAFPTSTSTSVFPFLFPLRYRQAAMLFKAQNHLRKYSKYSSISKPPSMPFNRHLHQT